MAGLSTGIGSLIALVAKRTNRKFLSFSLGFSAGVMIYISFVDLFPQSIEIRLQIDVHVDVNVLLRVLSCRPIIQWIQ